jgi:hypothetical protein
MPVKLSNPFRFDPAKTVSNSAQTNTPDRELTSVGSQPILDGAVLYQGHA